MAERAFARALGGSCHSPVAALARADHNQVHLTAEILSADGREKMREEITFPAGREEKAAELARQMLERAPEAIRTLFAAAA
jgi:hydroxymethylbilane synthase